MRHHDAEELWHRFGRGDGTAFAQLYRDHHRDVFRYCRSLLHDEEDAHDAAQGTWTAIWTTPGAARRAIPLRPWLFRIAHNEAIDILRRRRPHETLTDLEVPALDDVASDVELREQLATLRADLVSLPERQRAALLLREVAGLGHAEIAEVFGISAAAAKQTIYEARHALLEAEGGRIMACELVQRAISDGDGRVRRGRRLRAHLRGCASCRAFADSLGRRCHDLRLLFPAPASLGVLARATAGAGGSAGGVAGGGVVAAGGSVAAKLAVATAVVVVAGVGGRHELAHAGGGRTTGRAPATAPARTTVAASPAGVRRRSTIAARPHPAVRRRTARSGSAGGARTDAGSRGAGTASAPAAASAPPPPPAMGPAAAQQQTSPDPGHGASAPGQVKKPDAAAAPPGQAKKNKDTEAAAAPRGQAKKPEAAAAPPGQAKKTAPAAAPPGQAKKTEGAGATITPAEPAPPGPSPAAAGDGNGNGAGNAVAPPGQAKTDTPPGQAKPQTPPGQAKK